MFTVAFAGCEPVANSIKETFEPDRPVLAVRPNPAAVAETTRAQVSVSFSTSSTTETTTTTSARGRAKAGFLGDTERLVKAEAALKSLPQFDGKELFLYNSAHFYDDGRIMLNLRQPQNPRYVDAYHYRDGKWSEPKPVQLSVRDEERLSTKSVSLNDIHFTAVANIQKVFKEKAAEIEGAEAATTIYLIVWDGKVRWYPLSINGSRERYGIEFNVDGTLKRFKRE